MRFTIEGFDDTEGKTPWCVVDNEQTGHDGEPLIIGRYTTRENAEIAYVAVKRVQPVVDDEEIERDILPADFYADVTKSSEVLGFLEGVYKSPQNVKNALRGRAIIETHPDYGKMTDSARDELLTAATDTIADILHALNAAGCLGERPKNLGSVQEVLARAYRSYDGDFEDEDGV